MARWLVRTIYLLPVSLLLLPVLFANTSGYLQGRITFAVQKRKAQHAAPRDRPFVFTIGCRYYPSRRPRRCSTVQHVFHSNARGDESSMKDDDCKRTTTGSSTSTSSLCDAMEESCFPGAGVPRPDLPPEDIPSLLMEALVHNDFPVVDAGLHAVWHFAGETTTRMFRGNRTDFIMSAHETAERFPTSLYGAAMHGQSWEVETELNRVGGETGWIATQVLRTVSCDGRLRRWQWELRKKRRPPHLGCWYVESVGSSDRKGQFEPE